MADFQEEVKERLRRSLKQELIRTEDDFDVTRDMRAELTGKLVAAAKSVKLPGEDGAIVGDAEVNIKIVGAALKALSETEKAAATAVHLKLKQGELEQNTVANAKDRVAIVIQATAPGRIVNPISAEKMEDKLAEMFDNEILDTELKTNSLDLTD